MSRVAKGAGWIFAGRVLGQFLDLLKIVLLARLLTPGDFGLFGLVMLAVITLETFSQTGFKTALIQHKGEADAWLDTAWTVAAGRGVLLSLILFLAAPAVAQFFDEPRATALLRVVCFSSALQGFSNVGIVHFQKELQFHKQFLYDASGAVISLVVGLVLAILLRSAWALVVANLAGSLAQCIVSYAIHPYRPRVRFNRAQAAAMAGFGRWILAQSALLYVWQQGDQVLLGKLLGVTALGVYQIAYRLANLPATQIALVTGNVAFPAYAKIQDDPARLGKFFLNLFEFVMSLVIPVTLFFVVAASDIVHALLGSEWTDAVLPVQILAVAAFLRAVENTSVPLFMGVGKPSLEVWKNLARVAVFAAAVYPLTRWFGPTGTCGAVILGACATLTVWQRVRAVASLSWGRILARLVPGTTLGVATVLAVLGVRQVLKPGTTATFVASAAAGLVACVSVSYVLARFWDRGPYAHARKAIAAVRKI